MPFDSGIESPCDMIAVKYEILTRIFAVPPTVRGRVIEVPVKANMPLKAGDELFRIDRKPYEFVVGQKKAALSEAEQNIKRRGPGRDLYRARATSR